MKVEQVTITPDLALDILTKNESNRKVNNRIVKNYAHAMKNGDWKLNGESIKYNKHRLIDGQHRLLACIEAEVPFTTMVITDIDSDVFDSIDIGYKRPAGQIFGMKGEKNANLLAATVKCVKAYYAGEPITRSPYSTIDLERELEKRPDIRESVTKMSNSSNIPFLTKSVAATAHYIFSDIDYRTAEQFFAGLIEGIGLESHSPILLLRNKLIKNMNSAAKLGNDVKLGLTIKAWNYYRTGKHPRLLSYNPSGERAERFPVAI